jgi:hypothetical protein
MTISKSRRNQQESKMAPPKMVIFGDRFLSMKPLVFFIPFFTLLLASCSRTAGPGTPDGPAFGKLAYGDSVLYLRGDDYTVQPKFTRPGYYTAFPDDLNLNNSNGAITVSLKGKANKNTQTGLRYRIVLNGNDGVKDTTYIVIAGVNYQDKLFYLSQNDTLLNPVYNASHWLPMPNGSFTADNNKLVINPRTGQINLKKSLERGLFNDDPQNDDWRVVNIRYQLADGSTSDKNNLDVVVYFYTSVNHIPSNISKAMIAHQDLLLGLNRMVIPETFAPEDDDIKNIVSASKPRPPCIIIVGN